MHDGDGGVGVTGKPAGPGTLVANVVFEQPTGGQRDRGRNIVEVTRQRHRSCPVDSPEIPLGKVNQSVIAAHWPPWIESGRLTQFTPPDIEATCALRVWPPSNEDSDTDQSSGSDSLGKLGHQPFLIDFAQSGHRKSGDDH